MDIYLITSSWYVLVREKNIGYIDYSGMSNYVYKVQYSGTTK